MTEVYFSKTWSILGYHDTSLTETTKIGNLYKFQAKRMQPTNVIFVFNIFNSLRLIVSFLIVYD